MARRYDTWQLDYNPRGGDYFQRDNFWKNDREPRRDNLWKNDWEPRRDENWKVDQVPRRNGNKTWRGNQKPRRNDNWQVDYVPRRNDNDAWRDQRPRRNDNWKNRGSSRRDQFRREDYTPQYDSEFTQEDPPYNDIWRDQMPRRNNNWKNHRVAETDDIWEEEYSSSHETESIKEVTPCDFVMTTPVEAIFMFMEKKAVIQIWLYEKINLHIEGRLLGFDEFMNLVLDDAEHIHLPTMNRRKWGRILLRGENVTLIRMKELI